MFLQQSRKSALFFLPKQYLESFPKKNHPSHSLAISVYLAFSVIWPLLSRHSGLGLNMKEAILGTRHVRDIPKLYCRIHHRSSGFLAWRYGCLGLHTPNMAGSLDYSQSLSVARVVQWPRSPTGLMVFQNHGNAGREQATTAARSKQCSLSVSNNLWLLR